jgi:hypothetical protein
MAALTKPKTPVYNMDRDPVIPYDEILIAFPKVKSVIAASGYLKIQFGEKPSVEDKEPESCFCLLEVDDGIILLEDPHGNGDVREYCMTRSFDECADQINGEYLQQVFHCT